MKQVILKAGSAFLTTFGASLAVTAPEGHAPHPVSYVIAAMAGLIALYCYLQDPTNKPVTTPKEGNEMATTETATLTISSPALSAPFNIPIVKEELSLPFTGEVDFTASSPAGSPGIEAITAVAIVDGITVYSGPVKSFPVTDLTAKLGVFAAIFTELDATVTLKVAAV